MKVQISFIIRLITLSILLLALGYDLAAPGASQSHLSTTGAPTARPLSNDTPINAPPSFHPLGTPSAPSMIQSPAEGYWQTECVECPKWFENMTDRSLRLDADERPRIAYGGDHLYYVRHDGTGWRHETVDEALSVGEYASLALDSSGRPHISYYDDANDDLKYARYDGTEWQVETVDSEGAVGKGTSLALDEANRPHVAYLDYTNHALKYAWHDGTEWQIETVDGESYVMESISLALTCPGGQCQGDGSGQPHIAYSGDYELMYAHHDGTDWQIEVLDTRGDHVSLALDGSGRPHISYEHAWTTLKYARYDGTDWHIEEVPGLSWWVHSNTSLALDGTGQPHIGFYHGYDDDLYHVWHDGTEWQMEAVDSSGDIGKYASLALDQFGKPRISYYADDPDCTLKYAWHNGTEWRVTTVDHARQTGRTHSLALDADGRLHVGYGEYPTGDLKVARRDGTTWNVEVVDDQGGSPSLVVDGSGWPHISYSSPDSWYEGDLKYARYDGTNWHAEVVDSGDLPRRHSSLALDSIERPHISYCLFMFDGEDYANCTALMYARYDGIEWRIETVDDQSDPGKYNSLALDELDRPHIAYYYETYPNYGLRYAWHDGTDWQIEPVESGQGVGEYASLALDGLGRPHIAYRDSTNRDVKYAWHDGTDWQIETADDGTAYGVGLGISLALTCPGGQCQGDEAGRPHMSYRGAGGLTYARNDGTGWQIETVDSAGLIGPDTSLALEGANRPHIVYFDMLHYDLKHAARPEPPTLFLHKRAAPTEGLSSGAPLTYTLTLSGSTPAPGFVLNVRLWDALPEDVHYIAGSISSNLSPPAVYSPTAEAVTWQGVLSPAETYEIRFRVTPLTFGAGAPPWSPPIVNTAWLTHSPSGASVLARAIVNGRPVYLPLIVRNG